MTVPATLLVLAAQTSRPVDVVVRWERPTVGVLLFGALAGAALALALPLVWGLWMRRGDRAPARAATRQAVARDDLPPLPPVSAPKRKWSRKATTKVGAQARALLERGASDAEVARRLGLSQDAVAFAMRRAGEAAAAERQRRPAVA